MGTRGAYGFRIDGADKVTYNHFDSYPAYLGAQMVGFVRQTPLAEMETIARALELVDEDTPPTKEQVQHCLALETSEHLAGHPPVDQEWYELLRGTQGEPDYWRKGLRYMIDSHAFLADSLFCEWAYLINLDDRTLEVYRGFNTAPDGAGRYAATAGDPPYPGAPVYYGVGRIDTTPLAVIQEMDDATAAAYIATLEGGDQP